MDSWPSTMIEVMVEKLEDKSGAPVLSFDKAEQKKNWDNILTNLDFYGTERPTSDQYSNTSDRDS